MAGINNKPIKQTTAPTIVWTKDGAAKSNPPRPALRQSEILQGSVPTILF